LETTPILHQIILDSQDSPKARKELAKAKKHIVDLSKDEKAE
jgi:hypothetical protein